MEHRFQEAVRVLVDQRDLQLFAAAEVREHAGFRHTKGVGQHADREALEPIPAGDAQGCVENRAAGLRTFGDVAAGFCHEIQIKTNDRAFSQMSAVAVKPFSWCTAR